MTKINIDLSETQDIPGLREALDIMDNSEYNSCVYILKLKGNKWYVGMTTSIFNRMMRHFTRSGSMWTELHPPEKIVKVYPRSHELIENYESYITLVVARKYGWNNVRGGIWSYTPGSLSRCMHDRDFRRHLRISKRKKRRMRKRARLNYQMMQNMGF